MPTDLTAIQTHAPVLVAIDTDTPRKKSTKTPPKRRCVRIDIGIDPITGKRIRKAFYGKTLKEARQKRDAYLAAQQKGTTLADRDQTVAQWAATWADTYIGNVSVSTRYSYVNACEKLTEFMGAIRMRDVCEVDLQAFAVSVAQYKKSTVNKIKITVNAIFRRALANRIIDVDPTACVEWEHAGEGTHRYLSQSEIAMICDHWREHTAGIWAMVMLWAGLRRGEALALRWEDIDFSANVIHVRNGLHFEGNTPVIDTPKTPSSIRTVPILPPLRLALETVPHRSDYVCCSRSGALVTSSIWSSGWRAYNNTMSNILNGDTATPISPGRRSDKDDPDRKVFKIRSHDLRHTYASMLYDAGVDVKTAQKLLGHATPEITMRIYTHLSEMRQTISLDRMAAFSEQYLPGHQMGINSPENPIK